MSFNAWTKNGCSRLINEQMAEALWVAVPCVHISLMWELRRTEDWLFCLPICTGDPLHLHISRKRLRREKKNKKAKWKKKLLKCNFLSCTEEVFAHSGSKLTTQSTRFRLVHWAHDTLLHGVCSAGNTRRVCKQLGWASVLFLQLFYLCYFPSLHSSCRKLDAPSWPGGLDGQRRAACDREWRTGWVGGEVSVRLL